MFSQPTLGDVTQALESLKEIKLPDGDHDGDAINSPSVLYHLSDEEQQIVIAVETIVKEYTRKSSDSGDSDVPNNRAINTLTRNGYPTNLQTSQYNPNALVGEVQVGDLTLDLSDSTPDEDNDY